MGAMHGDLLRPRCDIDGYDRSIQWDGTKCIGYCMPTGICPAGEMPASWDRCWSRNDYVVFEPVPSFNLTSWCMGWIWDILMCLCWYTFICCGWFWGCFFVHVDENVRCVLL